MKNKHPNPHPIDDSGPILFCLHGPQGSGKDKQEELLLRTLIARGHNPTALVTSKVLSEDSCPNLKAIMKRGEPAPCDLVYEKLRGRMRVVVEAGHTAIILNGYPRYTEIQVDRFVALAREFRCQPFVVRIRADRALCEGRILRRAQNDAAKGEARPDDLDPAAIHRRLDRYFATEGRVNRRLFIHHGLRHFTVTASDALTKEQLHEKLVHQIWPSPSPAWAIPARQTVAA